jgi:hypothetical protein
LLVVTDEYDKKVKTRHVLKYQNVLDVKVIEPGHIRKGNPIVFLEFSFQLQVVRDQCESSNHQTKKYN